MAKINVALAVLFGGAVVALVALIPREKARTPVPPGPEPKPAPGEISVLSLVDDMIDLDRLARLPGDDFATRQESSYDRRSRRPEDGESWFANDDFVTPAAPNLVRIEPQPGGGARYVLLDAKGPGAVTRIWTATPAGTLRVYIDDGAAPALEAPLGELLSGQVMPFESPFAQVTAMGFSLYFPLPFRSHCLITLDSITSMDPFSGRPVEKLYYQVGYRQYPDGARPRVRAYSSDELARAAPAVARVAAALRDDVPAPREGMERVVTIPPAALRPGQEAVTRLDAPPGGGAITNLRFTTSERDPARLRGTVLSIAFDGVETVRAPLVDFFGTGPGWNPTASLPFTVAEDGTLSCRFVMPFGASAVVTVAREPGNDDAPVAIAGAVTVWARPFQGDGQALFHARFRPPQSLATRPLRDWHVATLAGRGRQVGIVLDVDNPPGVAWWGEGDEKVTVDGAPFPDLFGTGTEDYFGFAWSSTATFAHPYHALTLAPPPGHGFSGAFSMNRFLIADPVPFRKSLRFDLELWHWSDTTVRLAAMLYWYAAPGGTDDFGEAASGVGGSIPDIRGP